MTAAKPAMKMPELLIFVKSLAIGFVAAEVGRVGFYLGHNFVSILSKIAPEWRLIGILMAAILCLTYLFQRGAHNVISQIVVSLRVDLLVSVSVGIWANELVSPGLAKAHVIVKQAHPHWGGAVLLLLCAILVSPLIQQCWSKKKKPPSQLYFLSDEEIKDQSEDLLQSDSQAVSFADTVLASSAHSGLVFGIDGPWGSGKTSFINLAERRWASAKDKTIVCRFEPLRYATEPDLADRLIRELSASIQKVVFAPEFQPAASRYSRLIKGKADVSFLGFKLSLEPSQETVDELLEDIDEVLKRIGRRVIIVIDDLDRLDPKTINSVLFATRRTFKLSQATYILCYDTELLLAGKEDGARAREFLEKFITVKLSLFVDSSSIRDFLLRDWQSPENQIGAIPSDTMLKLSAVLTELASMLNGDDAANYLPLVGDLRKIKRFVNAMVLMQLDKSDLGQTDFNERDLIHLVLLHLNYPGLFRRIYAEETEGRCGSFSVRRQYGEREFKNTEAFAQIMEEFGTTEKFLLRQLFDVTTLDLGDTSALEEAKKATMACFNQQSFRNLEGYLKLIVRFTTPEPRDTFTLYQNAVQRVQNGESIESVLLLSNFSLEHGEHAHDQFWGMLVNQSHEFTESTANDAINTLIAYLPRYSMIANGNRGLRQRSIYALLRLLDRAGWGRTAGRRLPNSTNNVLEIAWRIFGEQAYNQNGLIQRLTSVDRGSLGWYDLMLFRLQCSADRQGQLYNLQSALIVHQDPGAATTGLGSSLALLGMRKISQEIFKLFKQTYIEQNRNFLSEVNSTPDEQFLGTVQSSNVDFPAVEEQAERDMPSLAERILAVRSAVKSFVIYQLSNSLPPTGSGVGCGHYDESGSLDSGGIAKVMNEYLLSFCFNPEVEEGNALLFLDHCLTHLSSSFFSGDNEDGYIATVAELPGGLDAAKVGEFWRNYGDRIRQLAALNQDRSVTTSNYTAFYRDDLSNVFEVLDHLSAEHNMAASPPGQIE